MKTIEQLKSRRYELEKVISAIRNKKTYSKADQRNVKRAVDEIKLIDFCIMYIETNPSSDIIKWQLDKVLREIELKLSLYEHWNAPKDKFFKTEVAKKNYYCKTVGIPTLKKQVKTLKYLR